MANHIKPSKEELKANAAASLAAVEAMDNPPATPPAGDPPTPPPTPPTPPAEVVIDETTPPAGDPPTPPATPADDTDWKKRYTDSTREGQVNAFKNKEINQAIDNAAALTPPTDEEMLNEYSEWEDMTPTEQKLAKDNILNKRRFELVHGATQKFKDVEEWNGKVDTFVEDPKSLIAYPELEGKQEEFKQFASKPSRRGLDFEDLVLAFNGDAAKNIRPIHKGERMFESGTGGSNEIPKPADNRLTLAEADEIRKTDYPRFRQLLKDGKIKEE